MAVLANCWLIIETTIIPEGLWKWFYLSFYIHPFFLFLCQIFLCLKFILKCLKFILLLLVYPYKLLSLICSYSFKILKTCVIYVFSFSRLTKKTCAASESVEEVESLEIVQKYVRNQTFSSCNTCSIVKPISCQLKEGKLENYSCRFKEYDQISDDEDYKSMNSDSDDDDDGSSISSCCSSSNSDDSCKKDDDDIGSWNSPEADKINPVMVDNYEYSAFVFSFNASETPEEKDFRESTASACINNNDSLALVEEEDREESYEMNYKSEDTSVDEFYNKYAERMRWFDVHNYERTCGISSIQNQQVGTPSSVESNNNTEGTVDFMVFPYSIWGKTTKKKLLKSIENDFERVYVAQSCLSWEALYHQYRKVESLASSADQNGVFYNNMAAEFQKFQILLERFMEDERCEGTRVWNYVRRRFSFKSLLQVPQVSGFFEKEIEELKQEAISVKEVLKAIEKCIETFWLFVKTDDKKSWWKLTSSLWTFAPVEDPRDLRLLTGLTKKLQRKELWLKDSQGKQRCWMRKVVNSVEESQRKEVMFTMIDLKLVSRVLQLPLLTSSQLKWCQEKLDNIEFVQGKIVRACSSAPLFPPSF